MRDPILLPLLKALVPALCSLFLEELERRTDLRERARALLSPIVRSADAARFMTAKEYAQHARLSERTIRIYLKAGMVEGEHFRRDGRTGRRITIDVEAADRWRASRRPKNSEVDALHDLATNEVLRRRAKLALNKAGGR